MEHELAQRLAAASLGYLAAVIRFYFEHRVAKARPIQSVRELRLGRGAATISSVGWFLLLFVVPIPGLLPVNDIPVPAELRAPLAWAGLFVLAGAVALFYSCHRALGEFWGGAVGLKEEHRLIRSGPYGRIRHPMYTAFFLGYLGALLLLQSWVFLLPIVFGPGFVVMALNEEEILSEQFPEYAQYRRAAGRFLPRLLRPRPRAEASP